MAVGRLASGLRGLACFGLLLMVQARSILALWPIAQGLLLITIELRKKKQRKERTGTQTGPLREKEGEGVAPRARGAAVEESRGPGRGPGRATGAMLCRAWRWRATCREKELLTRWPYQKK
jgi:hypothetical protein